MFDIPIGIDAQIRPKSGLADKYGVTILNSPATIDAGYKGEILILLINLGEYPFIIQHSDRIAQICFSRKKSTDLESRIPTQDELDLKKIKHIKINSENTDLDEKTPIRDNKGFGSSGIN